MPSIWHDSLLVPTYISATSAAILILHIILISQTFKSLYARLIPNSTRPDPGDVDREHLQGCHPASFVGQMREHIALHGGAVIFAYKVARFIGCAILLGFSIASLLLEDDGQVEDLAFGKHWGNKPKHRKHKHSEFIEQEWLQVALCTTTVRVFVSIYRYIRIEIYRHTPPFWHSYPCQLDPVGVASSRTIWRQFFSFFWACIYTVTYGLSQHLPNTPWIHSRGGCCGQKSSSSPLLLWLFL